MNQKLVGSFSKNTLIKAYRGSRLQSLINSCPYHLIILAIFFIAFILAGALIIASIEELPRKNEMAVRRTLEVYLRFSKTNHELAERLLKNLHQKGLKRIEGKWIWKSTRGWRFEESLLYVVSLLTHVGYGNMPPKSMAGRIFTIVYVSVGLPLTFIVVSSLIYNISCYSSKFKTFLHERLKLNLKLCWFLYLTGFSFVFLVFFLIIPSLIINWLEPSWDFFETFYFCFTSLSGIGFGDLALGKKNIVEYENLYTIIFCMYLFLGIVFLLAMLNEARKSPFAHIIIDSFQSETIVN